MTEIFPRFIWRHALPIDVIRASLNKPSYTTKEELEEIAKAKGWPKRLEKRRPFGMLLENLDDRECIVYSRTADPNVQPDGLNNLNHDSHFEKCSINSHGIVQININARIMRCIWESSKKQTWVEGSDKFTLACFCVNRGCKSEDKKLIDLIHSLSDPTKKATK